MTRVLVVAPHPDDEVIGCGGSLLKHARKGHEITVVTLVARESSRLETDFGEQDYRAEHEAAHRALGVTRGISFGVPSRTLAVTHELIFRLVTELRKARPDIVYVSHENEADAEHRYANEAVLEALWLAQSVYFDEYGEPMNAPGLVLGYEVWTPLARYQYVEDISDVIEEKVTAIRCYRSQLRHASWDDAVRGLGAYRGATTSGSGYAEVFAVLHLDKSL